MPDATAIAALLADVLGEAVGEGELTIEPPAGGGWSNETIFIAIAGHRRRFVLRLAPDGPAMFPRYDLARQHRWITALAEDGSVPVPPIIGADLDGRWLGRSAFVMERVDGRVPSDDRPSFVEAGWLHDADPTDQRHFHERLIAAIAALHAVAHPGLLTDARPAPGTSSCAALLADLADVWRFDTGDHASPIIDQALARLAATAPQSTDDVLLWGDARPANVIVDAHGFDPVALLDWELATYGPREIDLTWLAEMNRMRATSAGVEALPGFLGDADASTTYAAIAGQRLDPEVVRWSTAFNALRIAVLMHRHLRVMVHHGQLQEGHRILRDNVAIRRCTEVMVADSA